MISYISRPRSFPPSLHPFLPSISQTASTHFPSPSPPSNPPPPLHPVCVLIQKSLSSILPSSIPSSTPLTHRGGRALPPPRLASAPLNGHVTNPRAQLLLPCRPAPRPPIPALPCAFPLSRVALCQLKVEARRSARPSPLGGEALEKGGWVKKRLSMSRGEEAVEKFGCYCCSGLLREEG